MDDDEEDMRCGAGIKNCQGEDVTHPDGAKLCGECCLNIFSSVNEHYQTKALCMREARNRKVIVLNEKGTPIEDWYPIELEALSDGALTVMKEYIPDPAVAGTTDLRHPKVKRAQVGRSGTT